jgi:ABC-type branched-subunit amino acid transport system ATPase component
MSHRSVSRPTWSSAHSRSYAASACGVTVVLVEQNAFAALELSDRAYVLEQGRVTLAGSGAELLDNPQVRNAYLGA